MLVHVLLAQEDRIRNLGVGEKLNAIILIDIIIYPRPQCDAGLCNILTVQRDIRTHTHQNSFLKKKTTNNCDGEGVGENKNNSSLLQEYM